MNNIILDSSFLEKLINYPHRELFAKIVALNMKEEPIEEISGKVSKGTVNIDGNSSVRRTCSLTLISNNININDFYWGVKTKFQLYVGILNQINTNYPKIIWFKQGTFVITNFSISKQINNCFINISGKDKMCLLNGDVGGSINAITDFGKLEEYDSVTNTTTFTPIKIKNIIREMIHAYGNEPWYNIFINDLKDEGIELLEYIYEKPMYLFINSDDNMTVESYSLNEDLKVVEVKKNKQTNKWEYMPGTIVSKKLSELALDMFATRVQTTLMPIDLSPHYFIQYEYPLPKDIPNNMVKEIMKIEQHQTAGYRVTDLIYPTDLIANVGESITSILDKIVKMLGPFEYFYDVDGRFIFQKKPTFIGTPWSNLVVDLENERHFIVGMADNEEIAYSFNDKNLIISFQNKPNINKLKNDFSIWGEKATPAGAKIPIHLRYALEKKPEKYVSYWQNKCYYAIGAAPEGEKEWDWRELIYQMAIDYRKHNHDEDFLYQIAQSNQTFFPSGETGYEQYYIDMEGFWRTLYIPKDEIHEGIPQYLNFVDSPYASGAGVWNKSVIDAPETLIFWIDFLGSSNFISKYSVSNIGDRPKPIVDKDVKGIFFKETPNVLFMSTISEDDKIKYPGYALIKLQEDIKNLFHISTQGKSAKNVLDDLMYQHLQSADSISLTSIPIYYLQPNEKIAVQDSSSQIHGLYIINKINFSLSYNGTMSIEAFKAPERFL